MERILHSHEHACCKGGFELDYRVELTWPPAAKVPSKVDGAPISGKRQKRNVWLSVYLISCKACSAMPVAC